MDPVLHYFHDPLCGWCYAAEPLVQALSHAAGERLDMRLHGGGLFSGGVLPPAQRQYIRSADARIGQLTGQSFGTPYLDGLLADPATRYDSAPPITALLAAQAQGRQHGLALLQAIQHAHYRAGQRVVEPQVLADVAASIGLDRAAFEQAYAQAAGAPTQADIAETRQLMNRLDAAGFPTLILQTGDRLQALRHETFYGQPQAFTDFVLRQAGREALARRPDTLPATTAAPACDDNGCAL